MSIDVAGQTPKVKTGIFVFLFAIYFFSIAFNLSRNYSATHSVGPAKLTFTREDAGDAMAIRTTLLSLGITSVAEPGEGALKLRLGNRVFEGGLWAKSHVQQILDQQRNSSGAMFVASVIFMFLTIRVYAKNDTFQLLTLLSPLLVAALSIPIVGSCPGCSPTTDALALFARIGLAILPFVLAYCFWFKGSPKGRDIAVLILLATACSQVVLLIVEPKFCFFCLSIGIVNCASLAALANGFRRVPLAVAKSARPAAFGLLGVFSIVGGASATGLISPIPSKNLVRETSFKGKSVSEFVHGYSAGRRKLLVVSIPGCHACISAKRDLASAMVPYTETTFCGSIASEGCFETGAQTMAPLILLVDEKGLIVDQQTGWTTSTDEAINLARRLTPIK